MSKIGTEALVLKRSDYSETSQVGVLYTEKLGRMPVLAKGIKRPNPALKGPFDHFLHCEVEILHRERSSLQLVTKHRIITGHGGLRRSLPRLESAFYLTELLREGTADFDPDPQLFHGTLEALSRLESCDEAELPAQVLHYELHFLARLGFGPSWSNCLGCGREAGTRGSVGFSLARGGLVCRSCRAALPGPLLSLGPALRGILRRLLLDDDPMGARGLRIGAADTVQIRNLMNRLIERVLERELRSAPFLIGSRPRSSLPSQESGHGVRGRRS